MNLRVPPTFSSGQRSAPSTNAGYSSSWPRRGSGPGEYRNAAAFLAHADRHDILSRRDAGAEPQVQGWPAPRRLGALAGEVIDGETMTEFRIEVDLAWLAKRIGAGDYNSH